MPADCTVRNGKENPSGRRKISDETLNLHKKMKGFLLLIKISEKYNWLKSQKIIIYLIFTTCRSKPYNSKCSKAKGEIEIIVEKLLYYRYCLKEDCSKLKLILESPSESVKVCTHTHTI